MTVGLVKLAVFLIVFRMLIFRPGVGFSPTALSTASGCIYQVVVGSEKVLSLMMHQSYALSALLLARETSLGLLS